MTLDLFAGICVRDYQAARPWYERLLGREPAFMPHATEAVWELAEHRYLFIVENCDAPGGGVIKAERVTYANGAHKATYRDADGNEISFGGAPAADS